MNEQKCIIPSNANLILKDVEKVKRNFDKRYKESTVFFKNGMVTNILGTCGFHNDAFKGIDCGVDYKWLTKVLKRLKSRLIYLSVEGTTFYIKTFDENVSLSHDLVKGISSTLFENLVPKVGFSFSISKTDVELIKESKNFVTKDELRPAMCCTLLSNKGDCVATDGYKMVFKPLSNKPSTNYMTTLVPLDVCILTQETKINEKDIDNPDLFNKYTYVGGDFEIEGVPFGTYPQYERVIPKNNVEEITFAKSDFVEALELSLLSDNEFIKISSIDDGLKMEACNEEGKISGASILVHGSSTYCKDLYFDAKCFIELLKQIKDEAIKLTFNGGLDGYSIVLVNEVYLIVSKKHYD